MRCIFCKQNSESSTSQEHIVPESLGNKDHVLPPGWVCDACNNYLASKVEAPFMNSQYGRSSRFDMRIPSRRGRIPVVRGFHPQSRTKVDLLFDIDGLSFFAADGEDETRFIKTLRTQSRGTLYIPSAEDPEQSYETARFIGMLAFEILSYRFMDVGGWNDELVDKPELDELRQYVRQGRSSFVWPINIRRIYPADHQFSDEIDPEYQVLHEWDILYIPANHSQDGGEFYVVVAIFGVEYAINLGGPELDGYMQWLKDNKGKSCLYSSKNA